jgi:predicted nuclease with RNAse H fold
MILLGFDPGGAHQFGWCVSERKSEAGLKLLHSGVADNARGAVHAALESIKDLKDVAAAGIDSPLYWPMDGARMADVLIRQIMRRRGARNVGGTVQSLNSLRGACVAQGIIAARLLRDRIPSIRITETHPKALLWLIEVANEHRCISEVQMSQLNELMTCKATLSCEHQRDAVLGSIAAQAMVRSQRGWRDLFLNEGESFVPVSPVEYWMPVANSTSIE